MKTIHALLVDDDSQALATMETILEMDDFLVTTASSGLKALEMLERPEESAPGIDFMVVDLEMANLSGIELLLEMRQRGHSVPVMVVTGYASRATVVELLRQGVSDFLDKPVNMDEFRFRISQIAKTVLDRRGTCVVPPAVYGPSRSQSATLVDLATLGLPFAAKRLVESTAGSHLVLACRKRNGYDLLLADVQGAGNESFYVSVLIKSFFDRQRVVELGGAEFIRGLNDALLDRCLDCPGVNALFMRIRVGERRMEVYPAGYASRWYLGLGEEKSRVLDFGGAPLGVQRESRETLCEVPFACRDRLILLGEGSEPLEGIRDKILDMAPGPLEAMVDGVWSRILEGRKERRKNDLFLLGVELP